MMRQSAANREHVAQQLHWAAFNVRSATIRTLITTSASVESLATFIENWKANGYIPGLTEDSPVTRDCPSASNMALLCGASPSVRQLNFTSGKIVQPIPNTVNVAVDAWESYFKTSTAVFTGAQLAQAGVGPTANSMRNASANSIFFQLGSLVAGISEDAQQCLFTTDRNLVTLRAAMQAELDFDARVAHFEDDIVMRVPGVGVYKGRDAVAEYVYVQDCGYNYQYFCAVQTFQNFSLNKNDVNVLYSDENIVGAWNNFTRVSNPSYKHEFAFSPCSGRVTEWNVTFSSEGGIDYFVSGAYSNRRVCEAIQNNCTGRNAQFSSIAECMAYFDELPASDPACAGDDDGVSYSLQGNTTLCRFLHHFMMQFSPEVHCFHAGRGGVDANGHRKCNPQDCARSNQKDYNTSNYDTEKNATTCSAGTQADIETRAVSLLPHCIDTLALEKCTLSCRQALFQFGLGGARSRQAQDNWKNACSCSSTIRTSPASFLLKEIGGEILDVIAYACGDAVPAVAQSCASATSRFSEQNIVEYVNAAGFNALRLMNDLYSSTPGLKEDSEWSKIHLVDWYTLFHIACYNASNSTEACRASYATPMPLLSSTFGSSSNPVHYSGGRILRSHADVVAAMSNAQQLRSSNAQFFMPDIDTPNVMSLNAAPLLSSGTPSHTQCRKMLYEAWPNLKAPERVRVSEPPHIVKTYVQNPSNSLLSLVTDEDAGSAFVDYLVEEILEALYPGHGGVTNLVKASIGVLISQERLIIAPVQYQRISGHFGSDAMLQSRKVLSQWAQSYFGISRMEKLSGVYLNKSADEIGLVIADATIAAFAGIIPLVIGSGKRVSASLCSRYGAFIANPTNFLIEVSRLESPVHSFAFTTSNNRTNLASIYSANRDENVFDEPEMFNPDRKSLMQTLSFNAIQGEILSQSGATLTRACPAHALALRLIKDLLLALLPPKDSIETVCYGIENEALLDTLVAIVCLVFACVTAFSCNTQSMQCGDGTVCGNTARLRFRMSID